MNINQITIKQKQQLFCLNDLHRAAGEHKRHQVANWLDTQQAQELIQLLKGECKNQKTFENQNDNAIPGIAGNQQNQGLTDFADSENNVIQIKQGYGTYACKELVYAYAMWISPQFLLTVIRAFDSLVTSNCQTQAIEHKDEFQATEGFQMAQYALQLDKIHAQIMTLNTQYREVQLKMHVFLATSDKGWLPEYQRYQHLLPEGL